MDWINSDLFTYLGLPVLIFCARICDVTIGTIRIIMVSKGHKYIAPVLGFFEVLIWIIAISRIMQNLDNVACYIAYAAGFATGNFVGMAVEEKMALGTMIIRLITRPADGLFEALSNAGFGVTRSEAYGSKEKVEVILTIIKRQNLPDAIAIIEKMNPKAFYTIEEAKRVNEGIFPYRFGKRNQAGFFNPLMYWRKGK